MVQKAFPRLVQRKQLKKSSSKKVLNLLSGALNLAEKSFLKDYEKGADYLTHAIRIYNQTWYNPKNDLRINSLYDKRIRSRYKTCYI